MTFTWHKCSLPEDLDYPVSKNPFYSHIQSMSWWWWLERARTPTHARTHTHPRTFPITHTPISLFLPCGHNMVLAAQLVSGADDSDDDDVSCANSKVVNDKTGWMDVSLSEAGMRWP